MEIKFTPAEEKRFTPVGFRVFDGKKYKYFETNEKAQKFAKSIEEIGISRLFYTPIGYKWITGDIH